MYNLETYHQNGKKGKNLLNNSERYSALKSRAVSTDGAQPNPQQADPPALSDWIYMGPRAECATKGRCPFQKGGPGRRPPDHNLPGPLLAQQGRLQGSGWVWTGSAPGRLQALSAPKAGGGEHAPSRHSPAPAGDAPSPHSDLRDSRESMQTD